MRAIVEAGWQEKTNMFTSGVSTRDLKIIYIHTFTHSLTHVQTYRHISLKMCKCVGDVFCVWLWLECLHANTLADFGAAAVVFECVNIFSEVKLWQ